jgi:hypothetical protein
MAIRRVDGCCVFLLSAVLTLSCVYLDDEGDHLADLLNRTADEMITAHLQERVLIYHPRRGLGQRYSVEIGKHWACPALPCDAPFGEQQGGVLVSVERGRGGTGFFNNLISVPHRLQISKENHDTRIVLRSKNGYVEVTEIS